MEGVPKHLRHHQRAEYCKTRAEYRKSKELKAVKVLITQFLEVFSLKIVQIYFLGLLSRQ